MKPLDRPAVVRAWHKRKRALVPMAFLSVFLGLWLSRDYRSHRLHLSDRVVCDVQFYNLFSGDCTLVFMRDGAPIGRTILTRGFVEHPWAVIPGPTEKSVVCFSWLDTTFAAFTIDTSMSHDERAGTARFRAVLEEAVSSTNFAVRACKHSEVEFVADLLQSSGPDRWVMPSEPWHITVDQERAECLRFLRLATTADLWRDPAQHASPPAILPEG